MRNPLTFCIESWLGSVFVLAFSAFLVGWFFIAMKNFDSEMQILVSPNVKLKTISPEEKILIEEWIKKTNPGLSAQEVGYRYLIKKYPDKPWLNK